MLKKILILIMLVWLCDPINGLSASKEIVRLQADMTLLQQQVRDLQKSFDTQNAVLQKLVEQLADQLNLLKKGVEEVKASNQQTLATVSAKVESVSGQFSTVHSSFDLILERMSKLSQQLAEARTKPEVLDTSEAHGVANTVAPPLPNSCTTPRMVTSSRETTTWRSRASRNI